MLSITGATDRASGSLLLSRLMACWLVGVLCVFVSPVSAKEMATSSVPTLSRSLSPVSRSLSPCARMAATAAAAEGEAQDFVSERSASPCASLAASPDALAGSRHDKSEPPVRVLGDELGGVREELVRALNDVGITALTPVQVACIPACLEGRDVLAKAKTGTGKTLGFLIPSCERLVRSARPLQGDGIDPIRALVLSSTRELATQITTQARKLTSRLSGFNVEEILGGASITNQRERLDPLVARFACKYGGTVDLLVATPGRLLEHIQTTENFASRLKGVEILVLDEVDQLLDGGFKRSIEAIVADLPSSRQTLCFSATVPDRLQPLLALALSGDHIVVDCVGKNAVDTHTHIEQSIFIHSLEHSLLVLLTTLRKEIKCNPDTYKIIVFLPTARATQFNTAVLKNIGLHNVMEIHSRCSQGERNAVSDRFRTNNKIILLSSDVSARGVDYPDITLVVQVGAPTSKDQYVQRLGRTGRAGKSGAGTLLLCDYEAQFTKVLHDLPVSTRYFKDEAPQDVAAQAEEVRALQHAAASVDEEVASQTYRAWIMSTVAQRKSFKWTKHQLVSHAALFATHVLGRTQLPTLERQLAVKLGLGDIEGLSLVDSPGVEELHAPEKEEEKEVVVMKVDKREIGQGLLRDAKEATLALEAMGDEEALLLQKTLDDKGEALVAGFRICHNMVTVKLEKQKTKRMSSSDSKPK